VRQIVALRPRPTGVIVSGDCVYLQGEPGDYAVLAEEVRPLRQAGLAVYLALGNHDHREHFWTAFPDARPARTPAVAAKHVWIVPTPWANWFLLDSLHKTNYTPGRLGEEQLRWLAAALNARPYRPALIVAHHHPAKGEKDSGLIDTRAFFDVIAPRKQVKAYFYGHTHEWRVGQRDDVRLVNVPALAWLFDEKQPRGWLDVRLRADGAALVLNTLDPKDSRHGQPTELEWRPGDVAPPPPAATTPRRRRRFRRGYSVLRK
jgi:3',5'-cyclic AMP phosphodiesterase CpdA